MELWEISELDFMIEFAKILCSSENSHILEEKIDNLNFAWVQKFTEDLEPVLKTLKNFNKNSIEEKKARPDYFWLWNSFDKKKLS